jgi:hypothetical protein
VIYPNRTSQLMSHLLKDILDRYEPRPQGCAQTVEVPIDDQLERLAHAQAAKCHLGLPSLPL